MEKFWAVILIFVIVAAGGLLYVNQVYNPQKETQIAMAETVNQTLSAVRMEMGNDTTSGEVDAEDVEYTVRTYCNTPGNTVDIIVINSNGTKTYTNSPTGIDTQLKDETKRFRKEPKRDGSGKLISISFTYTTD